MSKLNALFIGNCQNTGILHFLNKSNEFAKTFNIKQYANWQLIENNCPVPMADIQSADLFVCQPLRPVHGCYSTDPTVEGSIGYYVREHCLKISYPYIFSSAMWPIVQAGQNQNRWFGGEVIDNLVLNEKLNQSEIIDLFSKNLIDWNYKERFDKSISILKGKETITDIIVSDFIIKNYKDNLLFLIPQHPTSLIFLYVANQILEKLNMKRLSEEDILDVNETNIEDSTYNCPSGMFPLHRSSVIDYGLSYANEYLENSDNFYIQRILTYLRMNHNL